ncbi:MAG: hypothetical protein EOO75_13220 [Myxococcales bacterium]|nr:MAG: hypothetical protein EOO75_13220 [Myxococcales bacterium]
MSLRPPQNPKVSGSIVISQMAVARALAGDVRVEQAIETLTPEQRTELREQLAVSWCSLPTLRAFHEATARLMDEPINAWHLRVVERAMQQKFTTIWRFFLRLTSPEALIKRTAAIYSKTYDTGAMEATLIAPGHSRAQLTGWPDIPEYQLNALAAGIGVMLRAAGRSTVSVRWARTPQGARFDIHTRGAPA